MSNTPATTAPTAAPAQAGEAKYSTMIVGIGKTREALHAALCKKADELGVKVGHVIWHLVEKGLPSLKNGDVQAPAGSRNFASVGSAPGFWIVPVVKDGKTVSVEVQEVAKRPDAKGREFYRYSVDEKAEITAKNRQRARNQALRGAKADLAFLGVKAEVVIKDLQPVKK